MSGRDGAAVASLVCSAVTWLCLAVISTWRPAELVWPLDLLGLACSAAALILAVVALTARRSALAWLALAVSAAFPIWLVQLLRSLPGDSF